MSEDYIFLDEENLEELNEKGNTVIVSSDGDETFLQVEGMQ